MVRIALVNQKGGAGKSTTAAMLALALARDGKKVAVQDQDTVQGTLSAAAPLLDGVEVYRPGQRYDAVFIDTPGSLELPEVQDALELANVVIVPTSTSSPDLLATAQTIGFLRHVLDGKPVALLFIADGRESEASHEYWSKQADAKRLKAVMPHSAIFRDILRARLKDTAPVRKVMDQVSAVAQEILSLARR